MYPAREGTTTPRRRADMSGTEPIFQALLILCWKLLISPQLFVRPGVRRKGEQEKKKKNKKTGCGSI